MKAVVDRIVQYANRYQLTNVETGEVLGTFDFEEVTGTVQQVGTEIDKELFDSIANDLAARVKLSGGELAGTIVTFSDISDTAANVASGDTSATLWGKVKNWFSRLKALAFKNKVAAGDFETGAIKNADVASDAAIAQGKVNGLMTDYVASISVSGRTVTYKNKNGVNMGTFTTQDTTYELASQSSNGLMSSTDKKKLDGIESGAQKNTVLGVKGDSESAYRTGNVNITKSNIGLGNVDNTSDKDKPVSAATQTALNGKANTNGTYPNMTVGKATNADNATNATKATQDANGNVIDETYAKLSQVVRVDAAQSLTDAQKNTVARNIERSAESTPNSGQGWYNILTADANGYFVADLSVTSSYANQEPTEVKIIAIGGYTVPGLVNTRASITCFSGGALSPFISKVRVRNIGSQVCIDVYIPFNTTTYFNNMQVTLNSWKKIGNIMPQVQPFTFVGTEDGSDNVSICEVIPKGISTNGQVYQQGNPVLVGDQSAIFESDGVTVKNATKAANATKATQDADGNVISETYAKLSQVVRKDALVGSIDPTSDAGKNWLANKQLRTSDAQINASGWYRIAKIPQYCECKLSIFKQHNYDVGTATTITINSGIANRNYVLINVENAMAGDDSDNYVKQVRFSDNTTNTSGYVDVYIEAPQINAYWLAVDAQFVYEDNFEVFDFESVTEAVAANTTIVDVPKNGGSNTNKPIYQQGSPVLVGYVSSATSTNGSLTLPSEGWYCINYKGTSAAPSYSTGVFYWTGHATYLPVSAFLFGSVVTTRAVNISAGGAITVFDPDTGESNPDFAVTYYKLA